MNRIVLHRTIRQFRHQFLTDFQLFTEQDIQRILTGPCETLLALFAERYDYSRDEAIFAWNEFVLRRVDGESNQCRELAVVSKIVASLS